ncbi:TonB-dependent receptor domain-containing protein [uncultured Tenacibaculum sp.]|uniref:TonB-dependent receptor n=1 Tax=uncultured Tenacibaculum sp. TaxID=174713 RepID=UPI00263926B3|nr:TonB-dependent receptor [uncultured Tenacibaculum sp.]
MMKKLLVAAFLLLSSSLMIAQTTITGTVNDASLGGPLPGADIKISRKAVGTTTDFDGKFTLVVNDKPPFTIVISSLGYQSKTVEITKNNQEVTVALTENATALDEVVVSASRTPERIMESPVTVERFDSRAIKNTSSPSFYDGLENLKGVDINTNSLTFKSVNTRGFATFANTRFMQLVDGMDNSSPALNFALGNLLGLSELDVKSVELLPGASSALYGANAFNGIMFMTSKSPFDDTGISVVAKTGFTRQQAAGNNAFYDASMRMAHTFSDYFAAKATFSYLKGTEWFATDDRNTLNGDYTFGDRNSDPNYDGLNVYGDEVATNLGGAIGNVSRTGYDERDLMDYDARSMKFGASLHYRPLGNDRLEIIWNSKYGRGNTIYQGANRYYIKDFFMEQHKLEFRGKYFFVRGYLTSEDAGNSYDTRFTAINLNRAWKSDRQWFGEYAAAYLGSIPGVTASNHQLARAFADGFLPNGQPRTDGSGVRPEPGSAEFNRLFNQVTADPDLATGSKFQDESQIRHVDANLNLKEYIDFAEVQVGGSYREYLLNSRGTIYTDFDGPITYDEYGVYTQIQKKLMDDRLKLTGSIRYDKAQNFDGNFSPRISVAYAAGESKNHNFRASFQTGFRNPTTQDQYIGLDVGRAFLVGSAPDNLDRYVTPQIDLSGNGTAITGLPSIAITGRAGYENAFSATSAQVFAQTGNVSDLVVADVGLVKPEKVTAFEVGYRSAIPTGDNKLSVDLSVYYNEYEDFIANENVVAPLYGNVNLSDTAPIGPGGAPVPLAIASLANGDTAVFNTYTNTDSDISSYGATIGLNTKIFNGFNVGLNYTLSKFDFDQSTDPDFEAGFNTPEHKIKLEFGHNNLFENFGFNINARWQDEYLWESTFHDAVIDSRTVLDAQVNYRIPSIKSVIKVGGANLTGKEYLSAPGVGAIGSQYFISWTINN